MGLLREGAYKRIEVELDPQVAELFRGQFATKYRLRDAATKPYLINSFATLGLIDPFPGQEGSAGRKAGEAPGTDSCGLVYPLS